MQKRTTESKDVGDGRLFTSLNDKDLRRRYGKMVEATGVSGPEALRQGLVRLISEFEESGRLVIRKLEDEPVTA